MKHIFFLFIVFLVLLPSMVKAETLYCHESDSNCFEVTESTLKNCTSNNIDSKPCTPATSTPGGAASSGGSSQASNPEATVTLNNPLSSSNSAGPETLIGLIIKSFIGLVGGLALVMTVYGGFQWLTSAGNPEKVKAGSKTMIWSIIGLIIVLASYLLVNTFLSFLAGTAK